MHDALAGVKGSGLSAYRTTSSVSAWGSKPIRIRQRQGYWGFGSGGGLARASRQVENGQRAGTDFRAAGRLGREERRGK